MSSEALAGLIGIYKFYGCSGAPRVQKRTACDQA